MATISEALALAIHHHQGGRLQTAEAIYRQVLRVDPNQAEANHFLGVLAHQAGKHEVAVEYIRRAIGLKGDVAGFHFNLGNVHDALNRTAEAAACYRRAVELSPDFAKAHENLGFVLRAQGQREEAVACFRRALALEPSLVGAQTNLGAVYREQGQLEEAVACYRRALELNPDEVAALYNLGNVCMDQGKWEEAAAWYGRAAALRPAFAEAHNNLGNACQQQEKLTEAAACYRRAIAGKPDFAEAHNNLGNVLRELGKLEEAVASCQRALELAPDFVEAHNNLGVAYMDQGKPSEAIDRFCRAVELRPGFASAIHNLAVALLLLGRYEEGWTKYDARLALLPPRDFLAPRWNGEPAEGNTIFLHCEQGFGDTLHFLRYAARLRERTKARRVILECPPPLARLLAQSSRGDLEIVVRASAEAGDREPLPAFDWHLPLWSLPLALGIFGPLPMAEPYVRADPKLRAVWRARLAPRIGLRVGLLWAGRRSGAVQRRRAIEGGRFLPWLRQPGIRFYSLVVDADADEVQPLTEAGLIDLTGSIADFADTAALMAELDLIISVDTAAAHLAGAMGRPVWTLLQSVADWRWGLEGETTAWYPTMRLFRQPKPGDWDSVLVRVGGELGDLGRPI